MSIVLYTLIRLPTPHLLDIQEISIPSYYYLTLKSTYLTEVKLTLIIQQGIYLPLKSIPVFIHVL